MIKEYFKRNSPIFYIGLITAVVFVFIILAGQTVPTIDVPFEEVLSENTLYGPENPFIGSPDAKVTIVEFSDYNCPACKNVAVALKEVVRMNDGKVKLVVRNLPLPIIGHETSRISALAGISSFKMGNFDKFHHDLFVLPSKEREDLINLAESLGMNKDEFSKHLDSPEVAQILENDIKTSDALKIQATPTIFVNGRRYDGRSDLMELISQEIQKHYQ